MSLLKEPQSLRQSYDSDARYMLEFDSGACLELKEVHDDWLDNTYLYVAPNSLTDMRFDAMLKRIRLKVNAPRHERGLILQRNFRGQYSMQTLRDQYVYVLVSDKHSMALTLKPGNTLHPSYRIKTICGLSKEIEVRDVNLGVITRFARI